MAVLVNGRGEVWFILGTHITFAQSPHISLKTYTKYKFLRWSKLLKILEPSGVTDNLLRILGQLCNLLKSGLKFQTRYSSRIAPINNALVPWAGYKAYKNKPYPILLALYGPRNQLICSVEIATLNRYLVVTQCISWTDLICSVHQEPSRQKVASIWAFMCSKLSIRLHSNQSLFMAIPKFTDLIYSVHQDPSCQKVVSIWAYMCSRLRVHSNHSLCPSVPNFTDLICSVHQDPSRQKVASIWAFMCSILWVHSNHSLYPSVPKFTDLICSVQQDPSRQKVASIWAYMITRLRVHSNHLLCLSVPKFTYLMGDSMWKVQEKHDRFFLGFFSLKVKSIRYFSDKNNFFEKFCGFLTIFRFC